MNRSDIQFAIGPVHGKNQVMRRIDAVCEIVRELLIDLFTVLRIVHHAEVFQIDFSAVRKPEREVRVNGSPLSVYPTDSQRLLIIDGEMQAVKELCDDGL